MKSQEGRYLKLKIKNEKDNTEITISNIYLEPDKENSYEELIPEAIRNADCIGGDLNKAETGMAIYSNVYHTYNLGEKIETIQVDHKISDHPILIFKKRLNIPLIENNETIKILDNNIIKENSLNKPKLNYISASRLKSSPEALFLPINLPTNSENTNFVVENVDKRVL